MIGEIRDYETAQIAIQASLTGHLVLATVHTNDAPSTVTRLIDMGVEPFLLLVEPARRAGAAPGAQALRRIAASSARTAATTRSAASTAAMTGYKGRTGVYELMVVDDDDPGADPRPRRRERRSSRRPRRGGLRSMREDGERLVAEGITSRRRSHARHARLRSPRPCPPSVRSARRRRQVDRAACSRPTTRAPRARSCARRRWCRWRSTQVRVGRHGAGAACASRGRVFNVDRPGGLDAPARRPGRLRACRWSAR